MENDSSLLDAAREMDQDALVKIFDLYSFPLFNYAARLCGDPVLADHIVGDVFARLLEQLSSGQGPRTNLRSYLYETTYHLIIDETRYSRRRAPLEVAGLLRPESQARSTGLDDQILFQQILHVMQNDLTDDQRHVIFLRFLEEFSLRETAAIMGKTIDHVKVLQHRAITALRRSIEGQRTRKRVSSPKISKLSKALGL
ncbi:MAG TPA: RNA polymerase sigma factor [Anaerolineales bacterium]